jgi:oligoendopeptidase F
MYAIDMLKVAGVDMSTPKPVADCMAEFEKLLDQFEALMKKQS